VRGTIDACRRRWRVVELPSGRIGAVGAENRSYEMQIAQKYPEVDGVGPNARRLAYGIKTPQRLPFNSNTRTRCQNEAWHFLHRCTWLPGHLLLWRASGPSIFCLLRLSSRRGQRTRRTLDERVGLSVLILGFAVWVVAM
jgi:hypothetical protein